MEEMMKVNYVPTDSDAGYVVEFIDSIVEYLLAMHYERGFYPSFIKEYMQKNREVSFIDCSEIDMDDMIENNTAKTALEEKFIPATSSPVAETVDTVNEWIRKFISNEAIDNIYDGHSCWIMDFDHYDLASFRGLLAKIDMRMMMKMSGPENWNTIKSYVYQDIYNHLHAIAYKECHLQEE